MTYLGPRYPLGIDDYPVEFGAHHTIRCTSDWRTSAALVPLPETFR